jgi:hypothetical protein
MPEGLPFPAGLKQSNQPQKEAAPGAAPVEENAAESQIEETAAVEVNEGEKS